MNSSWKGVMRFIPPPHQTRKFCPLPPPPKKKNNNNKQTQNIVSHSQTLHQSSEKSGEKKDHGLSLLLGYFTWSITEYFS